MILLCSIVIAEPTMVRQGALSTDGDKMDKVVNETIRSPLIGILIMVMINVLGVGGYMIYRKGKTKGRLQ